jgi:O-antigen ligase/tetratricopeptide (TPR) repeat protein
VPEGGSTRSLLAVSLGAAFFLVPLYPAFITLTGAAVPGVSLLPRVGALALVAIVASFVVLWIVLLLAAPRERTPTVLPVAAFAGAAVVAALLGFDPLAGALFVAILAGGVVWHATIVRFVRDPALLTAVLRAYLISGAAGSLAAIVMVLAKMPASLYTIGHGRAIGTFVLPGELAGYLIVYVPIAFALARDRLGLRYLAATGLVLAAIAFALTFSRAGWIGMATAIAAFVLLRRRRAGARYAVAIMGVAVIAVGLAFNAHHDPSENFTRLSIWDAALRMVARFPLSGVGPFDFAKIYPFVRVPGGEPLAYHAHSIVLTIAAETGLVGIAALFFGWWRFVLALRARLQLDTPYARIAVAIAAGLAGTWVQGLIDTVSVVIFGLWLPFMALALVCAGDEQRDRAVLFGRTRPVLRRRLAAAAAAVLALAFAFLQLASEAVYAQAASPYSLAAHLPPRFGTLAYEAMERVAPLPFVETVLADDSLRRGDFAAASEHAARLPDSPMRSDLQARIAAAQGRDAEAIALFLRAGDDEAVQPFIAAWSGQGRLREAYELERRLRDRLAAAGTRPNALAESWWRLGCLATQLGNEREGSADYARAIDLAPLNTKYLMDAASLAAPHDAAAVTALTARAREIDPSGTTIATGERCATRRRTR